MLKSAVVFAACLALVTISAHGTNPSESLLSQWTSFKARFARRYSHSAEEAKRFDLFARRKLVVDRFNEEQSKEAGYTLAVNHLSDRTDDELKQMLGYKVEPERLEQQGPSKFLRNILESEEPVPDFVDWRKSNRVSSVKNQGDCGSCWAFSAAAVLEGQERPVKQINETISLSVQNIMDCGTFSARPCDGGLVSQALTDIAAQGGLETDQEYPYLAEGASCKFDKTRSLIAIKGYETLPYKDEEALKKTVAKYGPVSVGIEVSMNGNFNSYKSGVFHDKWCHRDRQSINHAVLVVGYGTDPVGGDYWLVVSR